MPVWVARTQLAYGRFLLERTGVDAASASDDARDVDLGDLDRAGALLRAADEVARRCGMARLAAETAALLDRADAARSRASALAALPTLVGVSTSRAGSGSGLTARELAILPLLAEGCTNREIGVRLHISQHTAANHIRSILLKTGCANRTEAAAWALRQGLVGN
jgi:DNA-binding NarL/FixJ family response regulator